MANNAAWKTSERSEAKCIFIDLGAADGNTFAKFIETLGRQLLGGIIQSSIVTPIQARWYGRCCSRGAEALNSHLETGGSEEEE